MLDKVVPKAFDMAELRPVDFETPRDLLSVMNNRDRRYVRDPEPRLPNPEAEVRILGRIKDPLIQQSHRQEHLSSHQPES